MSVRSWQMTMDKLTMTLDKWQRFILHCVCLRQTPESPFSTSVHIERARLLQPRDYGGQGATLPCRQATLSCRLSQSTTSIHFRYVIPKQILTPCHHDTWQPSVARWNLHMTANSQKQTGCWSLVTHISEATLSCRGSGALQHITLKHTSFQRQLSVAEDLGPYKGSF